MGTEVFREWLDLSEIPMPALISQPTEINHHFNSDIFAGIVSAQATSRRVKVESIRASDFSNHFVWYFRSFRTHRRLGARRAPNEGAAQQRTHCQPVFRRSADAAGLIRTDDELGVTLIRTNCAIITVAHTHSDPFRLCKGSRLRLSVDSLS